MFKNIFLVGIVSLPFFFNQIGCGSGGCDGTIFINQSTTESVTVADGSAGASTHVQFSTFTLAAGEKKKICGDDAKQIIGSYSWSNGDTASKGVTCSSCDSCIFMTSSHSTTTAGSSDPTCTE